MRIIKTNIYVRVIIVAHEDQRRMAGEMKLDLDVER
jgi:hypothetical protein